MMKNASRGIPRLWKDGYKSFSGLEEAVVKNCEAANSLSDCVRSAFGPNGLSKIVINRIEKVLVTTDAATIISELEVQHPAAKVLCLAAAMQQREIGDGANFVVVFAGELLKHAAELLRMGLHPNDIVRGYQLSEQKMQDYIRQMAIYEVSADDLKNKDKLMLGIRCAIASKQFGLEDVLSTLVADACLNSMPKNSCNFIVDNIRTVKILGSSINDSFVVRGMVIESLAKTSRKECENTRVAILTCSLDATQTETKGTVLLKNSDELLNYTKSEEDHMHEYIKKLHDMSVGLVIVGEKIGDIALHFLDKYNMVAMRLTSKWTIRRLCRATKARPVVTLDSLNKEDLGICKVFETREIGGEQVSILGQLDINESEVSTIVIRGATNTIMADVERAIDDGVNMVRAMSKNGMFVAGAGAVEIELARRLSKFGASQSGLEQYAINKFAQALEIVPKTLAENSGLNDSDIVSKLYQAHETGLKEKDESGGGDDIKKEDAAKNVEYKFENKLGSNANIGVDIVNGGVKDMTKQGVIDLMATRQMSVKLATQAATTILRVDHIIMKKPAGGPRKPNRGHWDDDDTTW